MVWRGRLRVLTRCVVNGLGWGAQVQVDREVEEDDDLADAPDSHVCPISFQLMVRTPDPTPMTIGKPTCQPLPPTLRARN